MYELVVKKKFSAAHQLRGYEGKCERLHGHTYGVEVHVKAEELNHIGLAIDFKQLKKIVDRLLENYDHRLLNEVPPFDKINPSAENVARVLHENLKMAMPKGAILSRVVVWESENAGAAYYE